MSGGLTVLATSDLHGFRVAPARPAGHAADASVWLDNGDVLGGLTEVAVRLGALAPPCPTLRWLHGQGLQVGNVGNHDLDGGLEALQHRGAADGPTLLSANLTGPEGPILPGTTRLSTPDGLVGVVGVLTPAVRRMWRPALRRALSVTDPVAAARAACRALRPDCRWVVVLAHLGLPLPALLPEEDPWDENPAPALLAALTDRSETKAPLADLVVLGHTHEAHAFVQEATAVVQPGRRGEAVARVRLSGARRPPEVALLPASGRPVSEILAGDASEARRWLTGAERAALGHLSEHPLRVPPNCTTLGDQILEAARHLLGARRVLLHGRIAPDGPPVATLGEAVDRMPLLEPVVVLAVEPDAMAEARRLRDQHAAWAEQRPPRIARRHRLHAFWEGAGATSSPGPTCMPASWAAGQGGYQAFRHARILEDPGWSLVELLYHRSGGRFAPV